MFIALTLSNGGDVLVNLRNVAEIRVCKSGGCDVYFNLQGVDGQENTHVEETLEDISDSLQVLDLLAYRW